MSGEGQPEPERERFLALALRNPMNRAILERLPELELPDAWLVSGCLFQTVWNEALGRSPTAGILDYDLFYCDPADTSWDAEDAVIRRCARLFADLGVEVQVRNQARVHLWYVEKFGVECPPLRSSREGIDHFPAQSSCFGVRPGDGSTAVYAPFGFEDLFAMRIRPNPRRSLAEVYRRKTTRWMKEWPGLTVVPWPGTTARGERG